MKSNEKEIMSNQEAEKLALVLEQFQLLYPILLSQNHFYHHWETNIKEPAFL